MSKIRVYAWLKRLAFWAVVPLLFAGALVAGASALRVSVPPEEHQYCLQSAKETGNKYPYCPIDETVWNRGLSDPIAYYTLWLTLFTGVLAAVGIGQGYLIRQQVDLAREEFIASHHPAIILREVDVVEGKIHYMLVNTGAKATLTESWVMIETIADKSPTPRNLRSFGHDQLGPLEFSHGEMKDLTLDWGSGEFFIHYPGARLIRTEAGGPYSEIHFVGALQYRDELGHLRRSVFRRRWNFNMGAFERTENPDHEYAD